MNTETNKKTTYNTIITGVIKAKVPDLGKYVTKIESHELDGVTIPGHLKHGLAIKGKERTIVVNRHFYDIFLEDLGKTRVFTVSIIEKTTPEGNKFILIDYHKKSGRAEKKIVFSEDKLAEGILINNTNTKIVFKDL